MLEITFDTPFECAGQWRLAEIDGRGRFCYLPDAGLTVTFAGSENELGRYLASDRGPLVITGRTSGPPQRDVTFDGCYLTHRVSSDGETTATFLANRAFFGSCAGSAVTQGLRTISVTMTALEEWISPAGPFLETTSIGRTRLHSQFDVYLDEPLDIQFAYHDASIALQSFIVGSASRAAASFAARSAFVIRPAGPQSLDDVLALFIRPLESFVTLGTGKVNSLNLGV